MARAPSIARVITFPDARPARRPANGRELLLVFAAALAVQVVLHLSLLRLPYFWDEAGYYVPAARELLLRGSLIPHSTLSNAHPPLVMLWLAAAWKVFGYSALVTRLAMLVVSAFCLTAVWRLSRRVARREVAAATMLCVLLYPVFFAQSSLAHLDMAVAGFTLWALADYVGGKRWRAVAWFALAGLAKETAVITPLALFAWEIAGEWLAERQPGWREWAPSHGGVKQAWPLLLPVVPLVLWFGYHYRATGYVFGNPEYVRYNLGATLDPLRVMVALITRLWHVAGYMNLMVLTAAAGLAMTRAALPVRTAEFHTKDTKATRREHEVTPANARNGGRGGASRPKIALGTQVVFAVMIAAHVVVFSLVGGALLARYLLPVVPLVVLVCVSTLWRRLPWWRAFVGLACAAFAGALLVNPPYRFAPEDNLAYADFVWLHQAGARYLETNLGEARVLTAWPATDELRKPELGYVKRPMQVLALENFSVEELVRARLALGAYDAVLLFSTKYEPGVNLGRWLPGWERVQQRYFGLHQDVTPQAAAGILPGRIVFEQYRRRQWVAVMRLESVEEAESRQPASPMK